MPTRKPEPKVLKLRIDWAGPFTPGHVVAKYADGGSPPRYEGTDYGLYQIYGNHIVAGKTLIYVGKANRQTFSRRFKQHAKWLDREAGLQVFSDVSMILSGTRGHATGRAGRPTSTWPSD